MPMKKESAQITIADLNKLHLPDDAKLDAEWTDAAGYHRAPVTGAWESESGSVVMTVGNDPMDKEKV